MTSWFRPIFGAAVLALTATALSGCGGNTVTEVGVFSPGAVPPPPSERTAGGAVIAASPDDGAGGARRPGRALTLPAR